MSMESLELSMFGDHESGRLYQKIKRNLSNGKFSFRGHIDRNDRSGVPVRFKRTFNYITTRSSNEITDVVIRQRYGLVSLYLFTVI
jgi:hypothetical protein